MKPGSLTTGRLLAIIAIAGLSVTLLAWQQKQQQKQNLPQQKTHTDTIPKNKNNHERKICDLDDVLDELDHADFHVDLKELNEELAKIGPQIEKELAEAKIEIADAMKEIDAVKIKAEIDASLKEVDWDEIKDQVNESISKIEWDDLKEELEKVKEIDLDKIKVEMEKVKEEMKQIKPKIEKELAKAKIEIEKAKVEVKEYKSFIDGLEKDGLINKKEDYTIKHKNGELIINGKTQPAGVYNKYRSFLEKHKTLTIEKSDDDFDIDNDDDID